MQLISNNPFRVLGVLANAKATEIDRNYRKLSAFLSAGDEIEFDYDFKCLGELVRSDESAKGAKSKINLGQDKVVSALFWFYNGSNTDEPAFDSLKEGDSVSSSGIWGKLSASKEVTKRNFSAYLNLSTLLLSSSSSNGDVDATMLGDGIKLKLQFLESDFVQDFAVSVADETYRASKEDLQKSFIDEVHNALVKTEKIKASAFIKLLNKLNFSAKESILKNFTQHPVEEIEKRIEKSKASRKAKPDTAIKTGKSLYTNTKSDLALLKSILGKEDLKYTRIADKVADEILQCGIDYFKKYKDTEQDPSVEALECLEVAKSIAVGSIIVDRCITNIQNLQEWVDEKPQREEQAKVFTDLEDLKNLIEDFAKKTESVANAALLLKTSYSQLQKVKDVLGSSNEIYIGFSSRIASDAQSMMVSEINKLQNNIESAYGESYRYTAIRDLKNAVTQAWGLTLMIGNMDLLPDFKSHYNSNKASLSNLKNQLDAINTGHTVVSNPTRQVTTKSSNQSSGNSGCYIATMVYGSYEHPQVKILRQFRDEVLENYSLGRSFITSYYKHSPKVVQQLKNRVLINKAIKFSLDSFIKILKRQ